MKFRNLLLACIALLLAGCATTTDPVSTIEPDAYNKQAETIAVVEKTADTEKTEAEDKIAVTVEEHKDEDKQDAHFSSESNTAVTQKSDSSSAKQPDAKKPVKTDNNYNTKPQTSTPVVETTKTDPKSEVKKEPENTPKPEPEPTVCSQCKDKSKPCDAILDANYYRETCSSEAEANSKGMYYLDEVMYIGDTEITNYSVQPVYNNHNNIVYYGLNLWSSGQLIK